MKVLFFIKTKLFVFNITINDTTYTIMIIFNKLMSEYFNELFNQNIKHNKYYLFNCKSIEDQKKFESLFNHYNDIELYNHLNQNFHKAFKMKVLEDNIQVENKTLFNYFINQIRS